MNGLVATVHGEPTNMTAVATGILWLIALAVLSILIGLGLYIQTLTNPEAPLMASACFVLVGLAVIGSVFSRGRLGTVRDRVSAHLLPSQKSVTVLELTPQRLLINRTSQPPLSRALTEITAVRNENGVLVLEGEPELRIDASLNSEEATAWLHAERSAIIQSAGQPCRPPQELRELLHQVGSHVVVDATARWPDGHNIQQSPPSARTSTHSPG